VARSARITKIERRGTKFTHVTFRSGGEKGGIEIPGGMPEFRQWIREQVKDNSEFLVVLGLAQWLAKNPGSVNFTEIEGKTITLDLEAAATAGIVTVA
jgi:hypothetical protein